MFVVANAFLHVSQLLFLLHTDKQTMYCYYTNMRKNSAAIVDISVNHLIISTRPGPRLDRSGLGTFFGPASVHV